MNAYYLVCTRGFNRKTFATTDARIPIMLELFGISKSDSPQNAYNDWAKAHNVKHACTAAKPIKDTPAFELTVAPSK